MHVSEKLLQEIADNLESGFKCFVHQQTHELVALPDEDRFMDIDETLWEEEEEKVYNNREQYIEVEGMDSREGFRMMSEFAEGLNNTAVKQRLLQALEGRKSFANFKLQIDNSGPFREQWFLFKRQKTMQWVRDQLDAAE